MNTPRFSVVIPVYNAGAELNKTLRSVLTQSLADLEVWLINDGSTDDTAERLERWVRHDDRIRVIHQSNQGVSAARNHGAAQARGEWIAFMDADDLWDSHKLEQHWQFHQRHPDVDVSYAGIAFLADEHDTLQTASTCSTVPDGRLTLVQALGENPVCTCSNLVVRRVLWEKGLTFRDGMQYAEDQEWLARAIAEGYHVEGIHQVLVGYRLSPEGLSTNLEAMYSGWQQLVDGYADQFDIVPARALYCRYLARRALRAGAAPGRAWHFACEGVKTSPHAFLQDYRRGGLTLLGALISPMLPVSLRQRLFA